MSSNRRPSSIEGIKRLAKTIKSERGITHNQALDAAAKQAGFQNYFHALGAVQSPTPAVPPRANWPVRPTGGALSEFQEKCRQAWAETLEIIAAGRDGLITWEDRSSIAQVIGSVLAHTRSHAHLPTGGGQDFGEVRMQAFREIYLAIGLDPDRLATHEPS